MTITTLAILEQIDDNETIELLNRDYYAYAKATVAQIKSEPSFIKNHAHKIWRPINDEFTSFMEVI